MDGVKPGSTKKDHKSKLEAVPKVPYFSSLFARHSSHSGFEHGTKPHYRSVIEAIRALEFNLNMYPAKPGEAAIMIPFE